MFLCETDFKKIPNRSPVAGTRGRSEQRVRFKKGIILLCEQQ